MKRVLIANRGEIAVRVIRACRLAGLETVAVYSDPDATALHVRLADRAARLGAASPLASYLNQDLLLEVARTTGADAVHPGYGFLSENAAFARRVEDAGLTFIGPTAASIEAMGDKITARKAMERAGVPVVPGFHGEATSDDELLDEARRVGFPLLVKAASGGGGKGMRAVRRLDEFSAAIAAARREAASAFGDATVYLERLLEEPRHIEFQVFGDQQGHVIQLAERECSIQRRHQKIVEESPAPHLSDELRRRMGEAAVAAAKAVSYVGAGTIEFLVDGDEFYFLEMNTRLQVEHPVTEVRLGVDLVQAQLAVAQGLPLPWSEQQICPRGSAIEVRLYAEDPSRGFLPTSGVLRRYRPPHGPFVRHDGGFVEGDEVTTHYDPMLAKLIVWGETRDQAVRRLAAALDHYVVHGVTTNLDFLRRLVRHPAFLAGQTDTHFIDTHFSMPYAPIPATEEAMIAVAVAELFGLGATKPTGGGEQGDRFNPWQTLGSWRSGR
ncbi:MAG: acetyl-CoA carboxylase biotin carboxylase subunit [Myxococcales bacterium]|nr:acetyl-CoA carboxylase biotin carboxylase subunit [Myxococcales bacterium]